MKCPSCGREFPLKDFINNMDEKMEGFLENVHMDRF